MSAESELKALLHAGREFLLSLEDAGLTVSDETGDENADVTIFKEALVRAAKVVRS